MKTLAGCIFAFAAGAAAADGRPSGNVSIRLNNMDVSFQSTAQHTAMNRGGPMGAYRMAVLLLIAFTVMAQSLEARAQVPWSVQLQYPSTATNVGDPVDVRIYYAHGGLPAQDTACAIDWADPADPGARLGAVQDDGTYRFCDFTHVYSSDGLFTAHVAMFDARHGYDAKIAYIAVRHAPGWTITGEGAFSSPPGSFAVNPQLAGNIRVQMQWRDPATNPTLGSATFTLEGTNVRYTADQWLNLQVEDVWGRIVGYGRDHENRFFYYDVTVVDGIGSEPDRVRLRLFDASWRNVYDSEPGKSPDEPPTNPLAGSITIARPPGK